MSRRELTMSLALAGVLGLVACTHGPPSPRAPVIDMHVHATTADAEGPPPLGICVPFYPQMPSFDPQRDGNWEDVFIGRFKEPPCADAIWSPTTDEELLARTLAVMEERNVVAVASGFPDLAREWAEAAPDRFIAAVDPDLGSAVLRPEAVREAFESGDFSVLAEMSFQYLGVPPDDPTLEPYWALAEDLDIPVGIHMGEGPPGATFLIPGYRVRLSNPVLLEEVLVRHPRLRVYVMHYGTPFVSEMIGMLQNYPQLYVDIGGMTWVYPREYFYRQLKQMTDAGFSDRIMFGSDGLVWPELIGVAIDIVEEAPFLTEAQKRDILYNNAARFLRLSDDQIASHHRG
jgi:predicted TIM-barrel fold metal-dependent hydrolase